VKNSVSHLYALQQRIAKRNELDQLIEILDRDAIGRQSDNLALVPHKEKRKKAK
jgi:hypothetical protein